MSYALHVRQRVWEKISASSHLASVAQGEDDHQHRQSGSETSIFCLGGGIWGGRDLRSSNGALILHSKSYCELRG